MKNNKNIKKTLEIFVGLELDSESIISDQKSLAAEEAKKK